ncbi:MAG: TonB-dependent receptor [Bacteroidota bacterium]|nr:TonB-dependent receptor [Bacteroidota bacterium]
MKFFQVLVLLFISTTVFAQQRAKVTGKVVDKQSQSPLEYAILSIENQRTNYTGVTDEQGRFEVEVIQGDYTLIVNYMSFKRYELPISVKDNLNVGVVAMEIDAQMIEGVDIVLERSTVEMKLDKRIYNVGQDMIVKGGSVSDVLNNVPSVNVDAEGVVSLRGNENVQVLIDGKPSGLVGISVSDALRMLPADSVEKIEVITNPSARYEAEGGGGIINIILKKGKDSGLKAVLTASVGSPESNGVTVNLNYKTETFNIFTTQGYNHRGSKGNFSNQIQNIDPLTGLPTNYINESRNNKRLSKGYMGVFGLEWNLDNTTTWTNSLSYRKDNTTNPIDVNIDYLDQNYQMMYQITRDNFERSNDEDVDFSSNLVKKFNDKGHELKLDFSTSLSKDKDYTDIYTNNITLNQMLAMQETANNQKQTRNLLSADYVLPIGNNQFEAGYRGTFTDLITDYKVLDYDFANTSWEVNTNYSNLLQYKENVNALYMQYGGKKEKLSYMAGLRWEDTKVDINQFTSNIYRTKRYNDFFPSAFVSYEIDDELILSLNYSRRVSRPRSRMINPFSNLSSNVSLFRGNPDLNPSLSDVIDLGFLKRWGNKVTLSSSVYLNRTKNAVQFVRYIEEIDGTSVLITSPVNLGEQDRMGFEFTLNYSPFRWWRLNANLNLFRNETKGNYTYYDLNNNLVEQNFDNLAYSWFTRLTSRVTLPYKIDWQTNIMYFAPQDNAQGRMKSTTGVNMALSKDIWKEKATITLNVHDLFNSNKRRFYTDLPIQQTNTEMQWRERQIILSFTYRFNQKKEKESRSQRGVGGDDEDFIGG